MPESTLQTPKRGNNYSHSDLVMGVARCLHWFDKSMLVRWFEGKDAKRHRRIEKVLRSLRVTNRLRSVAFGNKLVYAVPRKTQKAGDLENMSKITHGLVCSDGLVRFFRSKMDGEVIPEKFFRGFGSVPEWGI